MSNTVVPHDNMVHLSLSCCFADFLCRFTSCFLFFLSFYSRLCSATWLAVDQCQLISVYSSTVQNVFSLPSVHTFLSVITSLFTFFNTQLIFLKCLNFETLHKRGKHENVHVCVREVDKVWRENRLTGFECGHFLICNSHNTF